MRFSIKKLPMHVRHTFYYDLRSAFLFGIFGGLFFPFMAIVGRKIGATELQIAFLVSAPYVANAFALLWTEDILGKGRVWYVVWPNAAGRALLLCMFFVVSPFWYTFIIFAYMLVTAIPFPSYASVMKANYPDELRGRLMSYVRVFIAVFWIISSAVGGLFLQKDTSRYKYLFPLAAAFGVLSALEFRHIKVRREKRLKESFPGITQLAKPLKDKSFQRFLLAYSVFEFGLLLSNPVYPLVLVDEAHISNFAAGLYGSVFSVAWLAGFFFWGHFIDRHADRRTLALVFFTSCLLPLFYLFSRSISVLAIAQGASGFLFAATELVGYVVITKMSSHRDVTRYMAANVAMGGVRGITAPFLGVKLYSYLGSRTPFSISLALAVFSIALALKLLKNKD